LLKKIPVAAVILNKNQKLDYHDRQIEIKKYILRKVFVHKSKPLNI